MGYQTSYSLRPASEADYEWLRLLHHEVMRESVQQIWGWDEALQDAFFREHFHPERLQIIQLDGRDTGVLEVDERPDEVVSVDVQISAEAQGRGIGSAVIRSLQERAAARNVPLTLQVNRANRARRLYERLGFSVTGETETHYLMRWDGPD